MVEKSLKSIRKRKPFSFVYVNNFFRNYKNELDGIAKNNELLDVKQKSWHDNLRQIYTTFTTNLNNFESEFQSNLQKKVDDFKQSAELEDKNLTNINNLLEAEVLERKEHINKSTGDIQERIDKLKIEMDVIRQERLEWENR